MFVEIELVGWGWVRQATSQQVVPACANLVRGDVQSDMLSKMLSEMVFTNHRFRTTHKIVASATCLGEPRNYVLVTSIVSARQTCADGCKLVGNAVALQVTCAIRTRGSRSRR